MLFWIICISLTLVVVLALAGPMLRPQKGAQTRSDIVFYRAQLAEVDRDLARDLLAPAEAEAARAEIARRLIATQADGPETADTTDTDDIDRRGKAGAILAGLAVAGLAAWVYTALGAPSYPDMPREQRLANSEDIRNTRPSQAQAEAATPPVTPTDVPEDYRATVAQLRQIVPQRPDDLQGWELLARHEASLRNYGAAARAQDRVIALKGEAATLDDRAVKLEMMVAAAGGFVSPKAEEVIRAILAQDEAHIAARFYFGSLYNQTDRPDIAFRVWRDIAENGPASSVHVILAREQIEDAAFRAGVDYTLPDFAGPTAADIENMRDLPAQEQQQMIAGMVAGLADRLADQGGPPADWARLITAYGVLGDTQSARAIWTEARDVFGASDTALATLDAAAARAGLTP